MDESVPQGSLEPTLASFSFMQPLMQGTHPLMMRDTVLRLLKGERFVRVGLREVNIWPETLAAWLQQGYPAEQGIDGGAKPADWVEHFDYDMARVGAGIDSIPVLGYSEVLEETEEWAITRDGAGAAFKRWKGRSGTPEHIDFRMTRRSVWERDYRPHLLSLDPARLDIPATRADVARRRAQGRYVYYQSPFIWENMRQMMGDLCLYESLLTDPGYIHDYCRVYTDFYKAHYNLLFEQGGIPDGIRLCEDLGYKNGLFCSPRTLTELIFPYYKEIIDFFHAQGLIVELHTCGGITQAMPLIVEAGFDILNPMENKAGCDPLALAERYGDKLAFAGGLDVRVLELGDLGLIEGRVTDLVEGMKARGARYVFGSDHSLTPLVTYEAYRHAVAVYKQHMMY